jgi:hypothetical protein
VRAVSGHGPPSHRAQSDGYIGCTPRRACASRATPWLSTCRVVDVNNSDNPAWSRAVHPEWGISQPICPAWKNLHRSGSHGWSPTSSYGIVTRLSQRSRKADSERSDQIHDSPRGAARHLCTLTLAEVPGKGERPEQSWLDHRAGGSSTRRLCNSAVRVWIAPVSSVLDLSSNSTSLKP